MKKLIKTLYEDYLPKVKKLFDKSKKPVWWHGSNDEFEAMFIQMKGKLEDVVHKHGKVINRYTAIDTNNRSRRVDNNFSFN